MLAPDASRFKALCQKVYFPVDGYSLSDYIVVNGVLFFLLQVAKTDRLLACGIDPAAATEAITTCENNVNSTIEKLSPFREPTIFSVEAVSIGVSILVCSIKCNLLTT